MQNSDKYLLTPEEFTECGRDIAETNDVQRAGAPWIFGARLIEKQNKNTLRLAAPEIEARCYKKWEPAQIKAKKLIKENAKKEERERILSLKWAEFTDVNGIECISLPKRALKEGGEKG
jgi:hypothetical protein|tara:strand:- start:180 stop:536 length:357 start_codon:yes stop_codon:yes gene_type:complete